VNCFAFATAPVFAMDESEMSTRNFELKNHEVVEQTPGSYEESFQIDPAFEFDAPKRYDFLRQDTEDELRACDEFFKNRPISPYSQQKLLREFMGMDDHQDFDTFACSVESTPVQTPRSKDFLTIICYIK
jgi:hypothetical protein